MMLSQIKIMKILKLTNGMILNMLIASILVIKNYHLVLIRNILSSGKHDIIYLNSFLISGIQ